MSTVLILLFVLGYLAIVLEHPLKLDKTVPALLTGALCWTAVSLGHLTVFDGDHQPTDLEGNLLHHIGITAEILVFLIGAMTIVELVDLHRGFEVITNRIRTNNKRKLLWLLSWMAFFLSAVLDNLTTTIVFVSLLRRLVPEREERLFFVGMVVIAANAGGAWSPIGDVTTTMLWVGKKITEGGVIANLIVPSIVCLLAPLAVLSLLPSMKGDIKLLAVDPEAAEREERPLGSAWMFAVGLGSLIFVPVFKTVTHLPPYMGIMIGLGVTWLVSELIHRDEEFDRKKMYTTHHALSRIEMSSILFFLGILMAVASLEATGLLRHLAESLDHSLSNHGAVAFLLGFASAVIDNVPLVAAAMGMYDLPTDDTFWHLLAFTAGTGGSMLIIGSAAGVAAMGLEKITFVWYLKNIAWLALLGYLAGAGVYWVLG